MINKIIAFENQLLQDRKVLNDLITECAAGNKDELARLKIEEMQREIDVMAKQVAALKAVAQTARPTQAEYQPKTQSKIPGQPQTQAAQMIQPGYRPQMQPGMPGQVQPGYQPQTAQMVRQGGQPQMAQKLHPTQAGCQPQKKDFEKTFGKAVLPVCASILIFISLIFFAESFCRI